MTFPDERRPGGAGLWLLQRITALLLLVLLLAHFWVLHYATEGFVTYEKVARRLASPAWKAFDVVFLVAAVTHGMNGLFTLVQEYVDAPAVQRRLGLLLAGLGALFLGIGGWAVLSFTVRP